MIYCHSSPFIDQPPFCLSTCQEPECSDAIWITNEHLNEETLPSRVSQCQGTGWLNRYSYKYSYVMNSFINPQL